MLGYFDQSARLIESRCVVKTRMNWSYYCFNKYVGLCLGCWKYFLTEMCVYKSFAFYTDINGLNFGSYPNGCSFKIDFQSCESTFWHACKHLQCKLHVPELGWYRPPMGLTPVQFWHMEYLQGCYMLHTQWHRLLFPVVSNLNVVVSNLTKISSAVSCFRNY